ncbi:MAG: substrate-binding domain-containing protein [Myxococcales bacterium]
MASQLENRVRTLREARGLTQAALCEAVQISRQTLSAIEAGRSEPSVAIALGLARVLGAPVEEVFSLEGSRVVEAELEGEAPQASGGSERVLLASIQGRWVAHRLSKEESAQRAADGLLLPASKPLTKQRARVELLRPESEVRDTLLLAGCAPALGLLAERTNQQMRDLRVVWLPRASGAALAALKARRAHVAGVHFVDERSGQFNVPEVKEALPGKKLSLVTLARWQQGLLVARGNPLGIRGVEDLARPELRLLAREEGSGARRLLEDKLKRARLPAKRILSAARVVGGHMDVAQGIALGAADVGVAMEGAALAFQLDFVPLHEERFDLVVPREILDDARVVRLLETLSSASFRRELQGLGGYDVEGAGALAAEIGGT